MKPRETRAGVRAGESGPLRAPNPRRWLLQIMVGLLVVGAEQKTRAAEAAVELPPMLVEESISSVPWLYVNAGGTEFLSRCSSGITHEFIEAWLSKLQMVRALVPDEFLARMDVPAVFVLYTQDLKQTVSVEIQRELQGGEGSRRERVNIAPNMRLTDQDMHASIVYFDEALFDGAGVSVAPGHVRYLLRGRVPELPAWFSEGMERTYRSADFVLDPITLQPLVWGNSSDSASLGSDPTRPRALLPANELFAADAIRSTENHHRRHVDVRASTQELFVRWAIVSGAKTRAALWQLAREATDATVTEEMFEERFGFGFSELRDRLSDFLPKAVTQFSYIDPGKAPELPRIEIERATPSQVARVRGEWERLAIGHVQRRLPAVVEPYIAQARRTLHRAYDAGDRDPRLLATMGLCEIDANNEAGARQFLEPAVALGVVRPRAYYELARIRFAEIKRGASEARMFSFGELAPVIEPLRRSLTQAPPLPDSYALLAEAWARCETSPNTAEFAELEAGAKLFARRPAVSYAIALALLRHGKTAEATAIIDATAGAVIDRQTQASIARLRAELASAAIRPAGDR